MLISLVLVVGFSLSALSATEGDEVGEEEGGVTTTTINSGLHPAVDVGGETAAPVPVDWTYRYMVPLALVLAALIILSTAIKYFTNVVRKRFRIVEE
jgi:hypothetical protein